MFFSVTKGPHRAPQGARSCALLFIDNWDDWGKYRTMFSLVVVDEGGELIEIGSVKIGQVGLKPAPVVEPGQRAPEIPHAFDELDPNFFSLGQGEDYYVALNQLSQDLKQRVLVGLRDCAFDLDIFDAHQEEVVMNESLLRNVHYRNVRSRLNRLTKGDAQLTKFQFSYTFPQVEDTPAAVMDFLVLPESQPPTNVHVLIGRNGVGKTRCMRHLLQALLGREGKDGDFPGTITMESDGFNEWSFAGVVLISFSAFDDFHLKPRSSDLIGFQQVGLHHRLEDDAEKQKGVKSSTELARDFRKSLGRCRQGSKAERWRSAVQSLEADDDLFAEADVTRLLEIPQDEAFDTIAETLFDYLSSGHAIILLTVTRLVELVDEKTLVLLDEPEGHLHPPLLAAFIRCLSDLLVKRNGVAIVATHSPVVLQEVPQLCAWKLRRSREVAVIERPAIETFGENIGLLSREVFGLQVTQSGYHQLLSKAVADGLSYYDIVERFNGQLGTEARAIVQALVAERDQL